MTVTFSDAETALFAENPDLARLLGALRRARGFALYFACCNSPSYRRRLVDALLSRLERPVLLFELDDGSTHSLDTRVENVLKESAPEAAAFIFQLEHLLPSGDPERQEQTLSELNWRRGAFARLGHPLVFWVPEWALNILVRGAPDFYDWNSGVYTFPVSEPVRYEQFDTALVATGSQDAIQRLTLEEKLRWADVLKELIAEADNEGRSNSHILSRLLNQYGSLAAESGDYARARDVFERALKIEEVDFGPDSPEVAVMVHNYGNALHGMGDLAGARIAYERALAIDETTYGPNDPHAAIDFNSLGLVLKETGDLAGARTYIEHALKIHERNSGSLSPDVASDLNNLGNVLVLLGNIAEARELFERALKIDEGTYGSEHFIIARDLTNLANVVRMFGDFQGARSAYERALVLCRKFLGESHPNTALVQRNLAQLLEEYGAG